MDFRETKHYLHLKDLSNRLNSVGEKLEDICSIITEPVWYEDKQLHTLCDLIILYRDFSASALELKGNFNRRNKAINQLLAGKTYIRQIMKYDFRYGLFVVYTSKGYSYERLP